MTPDTTTEVYAWHDIESPLAISRLQTGTDVPMRQSVTPTARLEDTISRPQKQTPTAKHSEQRDEGSSSEPTTAKTPKKKTTKQKKQPPQPHPPHTSNENDTGLQSEPETNGTHLRNKRYRAKCSNNESTTHQNHKPKPTPNTNKTPTQTRSARHNSVKAPLFCRHTRRRRKAERIYYQLPDTPEPTPPRHANHPRAVISPHDGGSKSVRSGRRHQFHVIATHTDLNTKSANYHWNAITEPHYSATQKLQSAIGRRIDDIPERRHGNHRIAIYILLHYLTSTKNRLLSK